MTGILDDIQKKEARKMLEYIAACMREPMPKPDWKIDDQERALLKRCWHDGTATQEDYNNILEIYNRFKGIKTPEDSTQGIADWVRDGRKKNGIE
jgi:hypothetical protein